MKDQDCVRFLQEVLPQLRMRWPGFRKVRRQVCKRIARRVQELGLDNVISYRQHLSEHAGEWQVLDEMCRITISRFYRDRSVFDFLRDRILPELAETFGSREKTDGALQVWCAGCASGEEPWTLRLVWDLELQSRYPGLALQITATDADPHMLERAANACYGPGSIKDCPAGWRDIAFSKLDADKYRLRNRFRHNVDFLLQDVRTEVPAGPFDLILCRHLVFTYFDEVLQCELLEQWLNRLAPGGVLVAGKQESLPKLAWPGFVEIEPHTGCYRQIPAEREA